eukprot:4457932-Amphidinium_carterae.1
MDGQFVQPAGGGLKPSSTTSLWHSMANVSYHVSNGSGALAGVNESALGIHGPSGYGPICWKTKSHEAAKKAKRRHINEIPNIQCQHK